MSTIKIFARLGFEDLVVPIKDVEAIVEEPTASYFIGYELEDGTECTEDGMPLREIKIKN